MVNVLKIMAVALAWVTASVSVSSAQVIRAVISDDGKSYAVLSEQSENLYLSIYSVDDASAKPTVVGLNDNDSDTVYWSGSEHVIVRLDNMSQSLQTVDGLSDINFSRWISVNAKSGKFEMLFGNVGGNDYNYFVEEAGDLLSTNPSSPYDAVFGRFTVQTKLAGASRLSKGDDVKSYGLHSVNVKTGKVKRLEWGRPETQIWTADEAGKPLSRVDYFATNDDYRIFVSNGKSLKSSASIDLASSDVKTFSFLGRGVEPMTVIARTKNSADEYEYRPLNLQTGAFGAPLLEEGTLSSWKKEWIRGVQGRMPSSIDKGSTTLMLMINLYREHWKKPFQVPPFSWSQRRLAISVRLSKRCMRISQTNGIILTTPASDWN